MNKKMRVGLIYGGKSGEHEVSLQTALAVIASFDHAKYEIYPFYITKQGDWRSGPMLDRTPEHVDALTFSGTNGTNENASSSIAGNGAGALPSLANLDVAFPLLHGTFGEDGTVQGLLEVADVPYVGAGVLASAVGMDKVMMKNVFAQAGLPQCIFRHFTRSQWEQERDELIVDMEVVLGYPCFVKPANLGSSVGISKAKCREELIAAVEEAFRFDRKVIVEEFVEAREIEVGVLGNEEPAASVVGEIISSNDFYDYRAKYIDGKSAMVIPAEIPQERSERIREMAVRAFQAIDGCGLSRVDFFMRKDNGQILINEINTMPGFTPYSMYPLLWRETGKSYEQLLNDLIRLAMQRFEEKQKIKYTFDIE